MSTTIRFTGITFVALAMGLSAAGCCGGEAGATPGAAASAEPMKVEASCDAIEGMSTCMDYTSKAAATAGCGSFEGKVVDGACPSAGRVVACKLNDGNVRNYYKTGGSPNEQDYAKGHCENAMGGTVVVP
jgi:hypothetical protein